MKSMLSVFFIVFPLIIFSQKIDTSYVEIGEHKIMEIKQVYKLKEPINFIPMTEAEVLEKGYRTVKPKKKYNERDSIIYFHENNKIKKIQSSRARYLFNYDENWNLTYVEKDYRIGYKYESSILFWENLSFEIDEFNPQVEGKIGEEIHFKFKIKNNTNTKQELSLFGNSNAIRLQSPKIELMPHAEEFIPIKIKPDYGDENMNLVFRNKKNQNFNFPIEVIGYDLDDDDFFSEYFYKDQLPFDFGVRERIVIKLKSGERLLKIYKEGKLVWNHPISQIVNKVDIAYLEGGEYLLEIIDLKMNSKKYCRMTKEGAN